MIDSKFKALVHYVCEQCIEQPVGLGKHKLNQILWNSEVATFALLGQAMTTESYIRRQFGPANPNTDMALRKLQDEGRLLVRRRTHAGHPRYLLLSLKEAVHPFNHEQINLVDRVIDWIVHDHVASIVRVLTENKTWTKFEIGQEIPHFAIFSTHRAEITEDTVQMARNVSRFRGRPSLQDA